MLLYVTVFPHLIRKKKRWKCYKKYTGTSRGGYKTCQKQEDLSSSFVYFGLADYGFWKTKMQSYALIRCTQKMTRYLALRQRRQWPGSGDYALSPHRSAHKIKSIK